MRTKEKTTCSRETREAYRKALIFVSKARNWLSVIEDPGDADDWQNWTQLRCHLDEIHKHLVAELKRPTVDSIDPFAA